MTTLSVTSSSRAAQALAQAQQRVQADRRQVQEDEQQLRESEAALAKSEDTLSAQRLQANQVPGDGGASLLALRRGNGTAGFTPVASVFTPASGEPASSRANSTNSVLTTVSTAPRLGQRLNVQA